MVDTSEATRDGERTVLRPRRADAQKNRERILRAAEEVFAAEGIAVPIDVVAERAGVGVGTLYRNFPTKEALFEAIVMSTLQGLLDRALQAADDSDPAGSFYSFLEDFTSVAVNKRDLRDALDSAGFDPKDRFGPIIADLQGAVGVLLHAGVRSRSRSPRCERCRGGEPDVRGLQSRGTRRARLRIVFSDDRNRVCRASSPGSLISL